MTRLLAKGLASSGVWDLPVVGAARLFNVTTWRLAPATLGEPSEALSGFLRCMLVNITQGLVVATVIPLAEVIAGTRPADAEAMRAAVARQAALTKPPGSLGRLEELSVQIAGIQGTEQPVIRGKRIIVAAGDHGVVARGVTAYPQEVTAQMVMNFLSGGAAINVLARHAGVELVIVDAGVAAPLPEHADLRVLGVGRGTGDITAGPAMTRLQAEACVAFGVGLALEAAEGGADAGGADVIGTGDMGIGNTTASSAITAVLTGRSPRETTGRGTGRTDAELEVKAASWRRRWGSTGPTPMTRSTC